MYKLAKPIFMYCETPLHAGSGTDLGIVDLPIQRERHTGYPKVESSGLKGSIREAFVMKRQLNSQNVTDRDIECLFGPEHGGDYAAALGFTDARLLLFPVKSMKGVFAWITCPTVLERFRRDLSLCKCDNLDIPVPVVNSLPQNSSLLVCGQEPAIILEEYKFTIEHVNDEKTTELASKLSDWVFPNNEIYNYWRELMKKNIVVLSDDDFRDFVTMSTEVVARIRIDRDFGTVAQGGLFSEEYLPSESVLYTLAMSGPVFQKEKGRFGELDVPEEQQVMNFFIEHLPRVIQVGGNATIGKGVITLNVPEVE